MASKIQLRRDTTANWVSNNPVLASAEQGHETDGLKGIKIGDGASTWNQLSYINITEQVKGFSAPFNEYYGNVRDLFLCQSAENWVNNSWTGGVGTVGNDTTNYKVGTQGKSISIAVNGGGASYDFTDVDMSKLPNGLASATSDYITMWVYIATAEIAKMAADSYLLLRFLCDTKPTATNYFEKGIVKASLSNGWNKLQAAKSSFSAFGSANWANVKGVDVIYASTGATAPSSAMSLTIGFGQMTLKDPVGNYPNQFQRYVNGAYVSDLQAQPNGDWFVGYDSLSQGLIIRELTQSITYADQQILQFKNQYSGDFTIKTLTFDNISSSAVNWRGRLAWYIDSQNYVYTRLSNGTLRIVSCVAGVQTTQDVSTTILSGAETIELSLIKKGQTFTAMAKDITDTDSISVPQNVSALANSTGYFALMGQSLDCSYGSLSIGTINHAQHSSESDVAKYALDANAYLTDKTGNIYILASVGSQTALTAFTVLKTVTLPKDSYSADTVIQRKTKFNTITMDLRVTGSTGGQSDSIKVSIQLDGGSEIFSDVVTRTSAGTSTLTFNLSSLTSLNGNSNAVVKAYVSKATGITTANLENLTINGTYIISK
jgi:hypothetical protein